MSSSAPLSGTTSGARTRRSDTTSNLQKAAMAVAAAFLLVGILGFIPGITSNYDDMKFAGHDSAAELLGVFQVSVLHNLVHLAFGVVGFLMAKTWGGARTYLIGGGVIYLLLFVYRSEERRVGKECRSRWSPYH